MTELGGLQFARARIANLVFDNSGTFSVEAIANASGAAEVEHAAATGAVQFAQGAATALLTIVNSGKVAVGAVVHGTAQSGLASNVAIVNGFEQQAYSIGTATASMVNSGVVSVAADAKGVSRGMPLPARSREDCAGSVFRDFEGGARQSRRNSGHGERIRHRRHSAFALASAKAYVVDAGDVVADVTNSGSLAAEAVAIGSGAAGSAVASAVGIRHPCHKSSSATAAAGALKGSVEIPERSMSRQRWIGAQRHHWRDRLRHPHQRNEEQSRT